MTTLTAAAARANSAHHHFCGGPGTSVEQIATRLVGLHNTTQFTPYLSVRARLPDFVRRDLEVPMWNSWQLARMRAMRGTMFVFPRHLLEIAAAATRHIAEPLAVRWLRDSGMTAAEFERMAAMIEEALGDGPLTVRALRQTLDLPATVDVPGIVGRMCDTARLVGGAPPRSWRSSVRQYHRWGDVLADVDPYRWDEAAAAHELIRRYIGSYGPVTLGDMSWWTGFTKHRCRTALEALGGAIERVTVDEWPAPLYRLVDEGPAPEMDDTIHALPLLDPYVQGYRDRDRLVDPPRHGFVYDGGGNATATLVRGGRIIGVWQMADEPGRGGAISPVRRPRTVVAGRCRA